MIFLSSKAVSFTQLGMVQVFCGWHMSWPFSFWEQWLFFLVNHSSHGLNKLVHRPQPIYPPQVTSSSPRENYVDMGLGVGELLVVDYSWLKHDGYGLSCPSLKGHKKKGQWIREWKCCQQEGQANRPTLNTLCSWRAKQYSFYVDYNHNA